MKVALKNIVRKVLQLFHSPRLGPVYLAIQDIPRTWGSKLPVSICEGRLKVGEEKTGRIAFLGDMRTYRQWSARYLDQASVIEQGATYSRKQLFSGDKHIDECDIVLHPVNSLTERQFSDVGWHIVPQFVNCTIDLGKPLNEILSSRDVKNELRVIRKLDYKFEVLHSESALEEFYYEMLRPTEAERHGELTEVTSLDFLRHKLSDGFILAAYLDSKWVGANYLVKDSDTCIRSRHVGWRGGSQELLRDRRIVSALLQEMIKVTQSKGYGRLNLGSSYPFANDGPLIYKLKWGADIELPPALDDSGHVIDTATLMAVKYNLDNESGRAMLHSNPVIAKHGEGIRVLGWNSPVRSEFKRQCQNGLQWLNLETDSV